MLQDIKNITWNLNILQDTSKSKYTVHIPRNNLQKISIMCVEYSHSYIVELVIKCKKCIYFTNSAQKIIGGGGFLLGKY